MNAETMMPNYPAESGSELQSLLQLESVGNPFMVWRADDGTMKVIELHDRSAVTIGRRSSNDVALVGDSEASRTHARLERIGEDWVLVDDGISRNGTYVDGDRVKGRRRLADGNKLRFGRSVVSFRDPSGGESTITHVTSTRLQMEQLTPTQRKILVALCRPLREVSLYAAPASNPKIAAEVFLGVDAVKAHLRDLYRRFEIDLPQNQKRARLAELALQSGIRPDGN